MKVLEKSELLPKDVDTLAVPASSNLAVKLARSSHSSLVSNAEYSTAVIADGKTLSEFIIVKRTGGFGRTSK